MASRQEVEYFLDSTFGEKEDGWIARIPVGRGQTVEVRLVFLVGDTSEETGLVMTVPLVGADSHPIDDVLVATAGFPFGLKRSGSDLALYHLAYTETVDENEILVPVRALARCAHRFRMP